MEKFYDNIAEKVVSKLKKQFPNGYNKGDEVLVPLNSVAYTEALIDSHEYSGGYKVRGTNSFDPWGRWVRTTSIRPSVMYDFIEEFLIEDYRDRDEITERVLKLFYR